MPCEQLLLDEILAGTRHEGCSPVLLLFRQNLSQPSHGSVEMVQTQLADAFDGIVVFPLFGGAVAARREEPMQHGEKDGALDGKLKTAVLQQSSQHRADRAGLPESLEDQRRTDPGAARGDTLAASMSAENGESLRKSSQGLDERVEPAVGEKFMAAEAKQNALFDLAVDPLVIHDEQIGSGTVGLSANKQSIAPVSLS